MARILVVDDEKEVAQLVGRCLSQRGFRTIVAYGGPQALEEARETPPDLAILDIRMPKMDGIELCHRLRSIPSMRQLPILFLTAKGSIEDKVEGFEAGADDYLVKPFNLRELELRVRALLRRCLPQREAVPRFLKVGSLSLDLRTFEASVDGRTVLLTPVQFDLLRHLMSHPGEVFSSEKLLEEVWDYPWGVGDTALVRTHIKNLREKIEPDPPNPIYIQTVPRHGYTIQAPNKGRRQE